MLAVNVTTQLRPQSLREPTSIQTSKDTYIIVSAHYDHLQMKAGRKSRTAQRNQVRSRRIKAGRQHLAIYQGTDFLPFESLKGGRPLILWRVAENAGRSDFGIPQQLRQVPRMRRASREQ